MNDLQLATHELLELGEFLSHERIGISKLSENMNSTQDKELKDFMKEYINSKKNILEELHSSLSSSNNKKEDSNMSNKKDSTGKDMILELLANSNSTITSLVETLTETTNPKIRASLVDGLGSCIVFHHKLSDMAISKGWYDPYADPTQQLQTELDAIGSLNEN